MGKDIIYFHDIKEDETKTEQPTTCLRFATGIYSILSLVFAVFILVAELIFLFALHNSGKYGGSSFFMVVITCLTACLAVASILGIVGAISANRKILIWFVSFLIAFLTAGAVIGIFLLAKPDAAFPYAEQSFQNYIEIADKDGDDAYTMSVMSPMRDLQHKWECCGFNSPNDFKYPKKTCCYLGRKCNATKLEGCKQRILKVVKLLSQIIGTIDLAILVTPIIFVICTIILIKRLNGKMLHINNGESTRPYYPN
ncbi:unnamed protein product [Rodentolepis nana]|uniref:Tetraspanin n=1 Tax=Rodentolepis nana TaxID=102285 RepID=A0A0R3TWJ1_RODNA|nr:unnamed protein product [Rodentolepis nana]